MPANWQVALTTGSTVGAIVGKFAVGYLIERFGYKLILLSAYAAIIAFVFILFFAPSLQVLLVGEVLCGLRGACSVILDPAYASEVCLAVLRGYLTTYVNLSWTIGQPIPAGVLSVCFAPESPWWLIRFARMDVAGNQLLFGQRDLS